MPPIGPLVRGPEDLVGMRHGVVDRLIGAIEDALVLLLRPVEGGAVLRADGTGCVRPASLKQHPTEPAHSDGFRPTTMSVSLSTFGSRVSAMDFQLSRSRRSSSKRSFQTVSRS